jgi:hypothetical protein
MTKEKRHGSKEGRQVNILQMLAAPLAKQL